MALLRYTAIASLDGYVEDPSGSFDWAEPDEEVHGFVNDQERSVGSCTKSTCFRFTPERLKTLLAEVCSFLLETITRMRSPSCKWRATSANTHGMASNFPGQSVGSCGQASQVAACGSHSAGMR